MTDLNKLTLAEVWASFKQCGDITNVVIDERKQASTVHFKEISAAELAYNTIQPPSIMNEPKVEIIYNVMGSQAKQETTKEKLDEQLLTP